MIEKNAETGAMMDYSVTVEDYRDFLCILFDLWYNHGQPVASIRLHGAAFQGAEGELFQTLFYVRKR
jgi:sulfatase maturation enzyme AslB (radical SAM superfamily)